MLQPRSFSIKRGLVLILRMASNSSIDPLQQDTAAVSNCSVLDVSTGEKEVKKPRLFDFNK